VVLLNQIVILSQCGRIPTRRSGFRSSGSRLVSFFCRARRDSAEGLTLAGAQQRLLRRIVTPPRDATPRPLWLALGVLTLLALGAAPVLAGNSVRVSGQTHSLAPSDDVLVLSVLGANGLEEMVWVHVRNAKVVRLWRDQDRHWEWRERPARLYWLPVNTFVTVIGWEGPSGTIRASRIEVPDLDSDSIRYQSEP
jgi:hypothetical protein